MCNIVGYLYVVLVYITRIKKAAYQMSLLIGLLHVWLPLTTMCLEKSLVFSYYIKAFQKLVEMLLFCVQMSFVPLLCSGWFCTCTTYSTS